MAEPTMGKGRVEAFSDGVLAVAITLLVLDLKLQGPGGAPVGTQLREKWPSFAAYVVSFFFIGIIWVNHHALLALAKRVDRVLLFYNLALLMFVTTIPFTTATLAEFLRDNDANARWAVALYGVSMEGMAITFTLLLRRMIKAGLLHHPVTADEERTAMRRFGIGALIYPAGTLIGFAWPPATLICYAGLAVYYMVDRTPILPVSREGSSV
jgi:uncharacterized membrane protein